MAEHYDDPEHDHAHAHVLMHEHPITPRTYLGVFLTLVVLTLVTTGVAYVDLHRFNIVVAVAIALTKTMLVILYFMHIRFSSKITKVYIMTALVWLGLLIVGTAHDVFTRGWFPHR